MELNDLDKANLKRFVADKQLFNSVQKALFLRLEGYATYDSKLDNALLGANVRALMEAKGMIKDTFRDFEKYNTVDLLKSPINLAR